MFDVSCTTRSVTKRPAHLRIIFRHLLELIVKNNHIESIERRLKGNSERMTEVQKEIGQTGEEAQNEDAEYQKHRTKLVSSIQAETTAWENESDRPEIEFERLENLVTAGELECQSILDTLHSDMLLWKSLAAETMEAELSAQVVELETLKQEITETLARLEARKQQHQASFQQLLEHITALQKIAADLRAIADKFRPLLKKRHGALRDLDEAHSIANDTIDGKLDALGRELEDCDQRLPVLAKARFLLQGKVEQLIPQMVVFRQEQSSIA